MILAQLIPAGTLSEGRRGIAVAAAGNKILFAGGMNSSDVSSAAVDIYDITTQTWSSAQLSIPRTGIAAIASGNKIYFAGGIRIDDQAVTSRVDIYDVSSDTWSTADLSQPRQALTAAAVGDKIMFTGGSSIDNLGNATHATSNLVDIYNTTTGVWTTAKLSMARMGMTATTAGSKVYFAGGYLFWDWVYDRIDVYDNSTNTWSISTLTERKVEHGAIAVGDYIYWAGGSPINNFNDHEFSCTVEKRNLINGSTTTIHIFQPHSISQALLKNNSIVFYSGHNEFDIYDPGDDTWSIGKMNQGFIYDAVICVNNVIYIAGGGDYGSATSDKVYKLEF